MIRRVPVRNLATQVRGVTYKSAEASVTPQIGTVGVVRAGNIVDGELMNGDLVYVPASRVTEKQWLKRGDVLIAASSGSLDVVGKAARIRRDEEVAFGAFCKVLRPTPEVDAGYFAHFFQSKPYRRHVMRVAAGSSINNLKGRDLDDIEILLPPIEEQRRIAAVLDAAEALRAKRRQALAKLDELIQAVFYDLFGDLSNNVHGWPVRRICDFVSSFQTGKSIASSPSDVPGGFRVLKVSAVTSRRYKPWESKPVPSSHSPPATHIVRAGDLLISRANTTDLVGACAYVETTPENHLLPDKLWRFVWSAPQQVEPLFVWHLLQDRRVRKQIGDLATGSSGSMKNISQRKFMRLEVPVPPLPLQEEFVRRQGKILDLGSSVDRGVTGLDTLFASLQQRAFRGEL